MAMAAPEDASFSSSEFPPAAEPLADQSTGRHAVGEPVAATKLKARPDLNGKVARVLFWAAGTSRYAVVFPHSGQRVKLRSENLEAQPSETVLLLPAAGQGDE